MNYQDIEKVNSEIKTLTIEKQNKKTGKIEKKEYALVPGRVTAFRKLFPEGFIKTEIVSHDGTTVLMQAVAGYYDNGVPVILGSGFAQEVKGQGLVNGTSYIENCETSAVGRALGFIGLGLEGGGICSAEELANAITAQNQIKEAESHVNDYPAPAGGPVQKLDKLPTNKEPSPEVKYLIEAMKELREARGISIAANKELFNKQKQALVAAGLAPDKATSEYTLDELKGLVDAMMLNFDPDGTELKSK